MIYEQYQAIKCVQPEAVLLLQVGEFYQAYSKDARTLATTIGGNCRSVSFGKRRVDTYSAPAATLDSTIQALLGGAHKIAIAQPTTHKEAAGQLIERVVIDGCIFQPDEERSVLP